MHHYRFKFTGYNTPVLSIQVKFIFQNLYNLLIMEGTVEKHFWTLLTPFYTREHKRCTGNESVT